jgi:hypothetical protein
MAQVLPMEISVVASGFYYYHDLGVDPAGSAHAYIDETGIDQLYYNSNAGGPWGTPQYIHHTSDWGSINVSGAVDSDGDSHIAFDGGRGGRADDFYYATNRSGSWVCTVVYPGMRWYALDLGPAPDELPRVSYYDNYSGLNYATMAANQTWSSVNVDHSGGVTTYAGRYSDLIVDDSDYGHISYYYYVDKDIRYATNSSGSWQWEVVASDPNIASKSWITMAPNGTVIVNYRIGGQIWIARREGGSWIPTPVTPPGNYGQSDVKTDAFGLGRVIVVYNDPGADKLMLAVENGDTFEHYEILDRAVGGDGPILQVQDGLAHVLAWDQAAREVLYLVGELPPVCGIDEQPKTDLPDAACSLDLRMAPNPVTAGGLIRFHLHRAESAAVEIFDVGGREVWRWAAARRAAGEVELPWGAIDATGRPLPSGAYLCTLRAGDAVQTHRCLIVR